MAHVISFGILHKVFSGPLEVECFHDLTGLLKLSPTCYVNEFAFFSLFEYFIHGSTFRLLSFRIAAVRCM